MGKSVTKKGESAMTFSNAKPGYMGNEERGQENVALEDITIPRLDVLQSLSPQRKKNDPAYIEGAEEGMLFNTVTGKLYRDGAVFVPCYFKKEWLIWKKQNKGGGFNGAFDSEAAAAMEFADKGYNEDYEIVDTGNHFGLIVDGNTIEEIVVSMSKSKMKVSRQLNTIVKMRGGDRFSSAYNITAVEDQNKEGQDYFNLKITPLGYVPENIYQAGEKLYKAISDGERKVSHEAEAKSEKTVGDEY